MTNDDERGRGCQKFDDVIICEQPLISCTDEIWVENPNKF